jgi:two-component system sensor histidine kinase BaeS
VIAGYFEAFQDGVLQPTSDRISTLNQEVILLQRLVEDLRTLSLSDMGRLSLHPERVGVQELMEQVYQRFLHQAQRQNIALRKEIQTEQTLVVDVSYTRRIFDNLIENAIRHTPQGGTITLSAKQVEETVCFTIADTGPGIPPDKLPRIFDRFYRVDPTRKQNGNETGLGLAIAKALVELHHGTIEVDSALGQGAKFTVSLPVMHPKIWTQKSGL